MNQSVLTIALMIAVFALISCGTSTTISVKSGESIQAAIKAAHPGDIIEVHSGLYPENLLINKPLIIRGTDSGGGKPTVNVEDGSAITLNAGGIVLEGMQAISAGGWETDAGIKIVSNGNTIRNNIASGDRSAGIAVIGAKNNMIIGNIANGNSNCGISLTNSSDNILNNNTANQNKYGIQLVNSDYNEIVGNTAIGNRFNGISIENSLRNIVEGNYAGSNWAGVTLDGSKDNIIRKNEIVGNEKGIYVAYQNNTNDIKAEGKGVSISYGSKFSNSGRSANTNNTIYLNNLSNTNNAYDDGQNRWDNGRLGNNYSDFNDPGEGCAGGKVCTSEHAISGGQSIDRYPLVMVAAQSQPKPAPTSSGRNGTDLRLEKHVFAPGSEITINFTAPKDQEAWVAIAQGNESFGEQHIGQNTSGRLSFTAPEKRGKYSLRMYSREREFLSMPFSVANASISAEPSSVGTCEKIYISYAGAPGDNSGWIGMYPSNSSVAVSKQQLQGNDNGTITFSAPDPGIYDFRMFDSSLSEPICWSKAVKVEAKSGIKVIAEPSKVAPGGTITVTFWGSPLSGTGVIGMYGITSPDKFHIEKRRIGPRSCGTMTFRAPMKPGQYDFRLFENDVIRPILGMSNAVTVA